MTINFKEERNLNQLLETLFNFLKENYKAIGIMLLNYAGPFVLVSAISSVYLTRSLANGLEADLTDYIGLYNAMSSSPYYWISLVFNLIASTVILGIVFFYIKHYLNSEIENISSDIILGEIKENFLLILTTNILLGLAYTAGLFVFLIGAIYLFVALAFTVFIRIHEGLSTGEAMKRSLYLVKDNWWDTALKQLVVFGIVILLSYVLSLPEIIYSAINSYSSGVILPNDTSIIKLVLSTFSSFASSLLVSIYYIAIVFIYFSLREKKEASSLNDRLKEF